MRLFNIQKYCLGLMAVVSLGAVSCTNEAELDSAQERGDVVFSAQVDKVVTRITDNKWDGGELVGVKAGETVKTYKVTATGKMSTEDEPYTWDGTSYDVLAWSPLTTEQINLKDQTTTEKFFACDLLVSSAKVESKNVRFAFGHQMTRMWWELQKFEGYTESQVNEARISFIGYGAVTYAAGEVTPIGDAGQLISTRNSKGEYYRNGEAMMVPGEMWDKPLIQVEIGGDTYIYTPSKDNQNDVAKNTGKLLPNTWQRYYLSVSKKGLTVEMEADEVGWDNTNISGDEITDAMFKAAISDDVSALPNYKVEGLEADFITDKVRGFSITYKEEKASGGIAYEGLADRTRTVGSDGTVTFTFSNICSDLKLTYTEEYMEIGYYFYKDGTYGAKYKADGTVGVIYKVGKHETDDASNYEGTGLKTIHGYVVALADEVDGETQFFKWKDGSAGLYGAEFPENGHIGDGKTSLYIGYSNTRYLIEKAAAAEATAVPAASTSTRKNGSGLISGTSGWYLPSHTQLKDLATLANKAIENYQVLNGTYWDSSFDSDPNAYIVIFGENGAISSPDFYRSVDSTNKVRLILTF